jgi:uncharacterized protein (DUF2384 family)
MALAIAQQLEMEAARDTVEEARRCFGLKYVELAEALGATPRSLLRCRNLASVPSRPVQARLEKVRQISHLLGEGFGNEDSEMGWLYSPVSMLRGRRPIDLIRSGELDPVLAIPAGLYSSA